MMILKRFPSLEVQADDCSWKDIIKSLRHKDQQPDAPGDG